MPDGLDTEWSTETRQRIGRQFSLLGKVGFWIQLALLAVAVVLTALILFLGPASRGGAIGFNLGTFLSLASVIVTIFTTFWFFRYVQLGSDLKDPERYPPASSLVSTLWIGLWAGCLGLAFSMLVLIGSAWRMMFVLLANPQSGMLIAPNLGTYPTFSISAMDAVNLVSLLVMLAAEMIVVGITLWLLFTITWRFRAQGPSDPNREATTASAE